jgi:DNA-cytosine methyltransferase
MTKPTFISFFSGIEGFRLGLEAAGWKCVHSVEIDEFCAKVQEARYGHGPESTDITKVKARNLPDADMWVGGFPCQDLSVAGERKGIVHGNRSALWWTWHSLIKHGKPLLVLIENVPGWLSSNDGHDWELFLDSVSELGYIMEATELDAQFYGVPQRRRRIFCLLVRADAGLKKRTHFYDALRCVTACETLRDALAVLRMRHAAGSIPLESAGTSSRNGGQASTEKSEDSAEDYRTAFSPENSELLSLGSTTTGENLVLSYAEAHAGLRRKIVSFANTPDGFRLKNLLDGWDGMSGACLDTLSTSLESQPGFSGRTRKDTSGARTSVCISRSWKGSSDALSDVASRSTTSTVSAAIIAEATCSFAKTLVFITERIGASSGFCDLCLSAVSSALAALEECITSLEAIGNDLFAGPRVHAQAISLLADCSSAVESLRRVGASRQQEILPEPEGGCGHLEEGGEKGKIAAGELARSLGAVGGGNDYGAGKGTIVPPRVANAVTASAGHHGHSSPRGDGTDNLVAATLGTNHKPDRGQRGENIVAGTLQSCSEGQGRKTPEVDHLVASSDKAHAVSKGTGGGLGGRDGQDDYVLVEGDSAASTPRLPRLRAGCGRGGETSILRMGHTSADPLVKGKVTDTLGTGTGHGGCADQAVAFAERTRDGVKQVEVMKDGLTPALTNPGDGGRTDAVRVLVPQVFEPRCARNGRGMPEDVCPPLKAESGTTGKGDGAPCVVAPETAAPITAGSNPNSNAAGRRREDDENLVVSDKGPAATVRAHHKQGQDTPVVAVNVEAGLAPHGSMKGGNKSPTVQATEGKGKTVVAPCVTHVFERTGGETEAARLVQQPLFIDSYAVHGSSSPNQNPVKKDGKSDALNCTGPGAVAFNPQAGGSHDRLNVSSKGTDALSRTQTPAVAYVKKGREHHDDGETWGNGEVAPTLNINDYGGPARATAVAVDPVPMTVRRLTPTECERLQGFPDGWTCTCQVRPDCPDRRIPPWLDPSTFQLGGCGHSSCGCRCSDSPRYKSLGNAVATCAVQWIGARMGIEAELSAREDRCPKKIGS